MPTDDQTTEQGINSLPASARQTLEAHAAAGWPTPGVPDWLSGGYVTKERLLEALYLLADYVDRATGHPDAQMSPGQDTELAEAADAPERASA